MTTLTVEIQFAARRNGVPHPRALRRWAIDAYCRGNLRSAPSPRPPASSQSLTIRIVGAAESRKLNRTWRGKDKPTNVLSFPSGPSPGESKAPTKRSSLAPAPSPRPPAFLGDLAICAPVVAREAREQEKSLQSHWAHMVTHGVLHLLGYDHENDRDAARMESIEVKILNQLGHPDPYV